MLIKTNCQDLFIQKISVKYLYEKIIIISFYS